MFVLDRSSLAAKSMPHNRIPSLSSLPAQENLACDLCAEAVRLKSPDVRRTRADFTEEKRIARVIIGPAEQQVFGATFSSIAHQLAGLRAWNLIPRSSRVTKSSNP
jgi:K+-sensing histidine kinase KdpD